MNETMNETKATPMEKLATFIVDKRNLFFLITIIMLIFSAFSCFSFFISLRWYSVFFQQIGLMLKMTLRNIFRTAPRQGAVLQ